MRFINFLLAGICLVNTGYTQNNSFNKPPVSFLSPDAASLGRYGTFNVNHYTGAPNIAIPIYEIKESGLSIPISISYDASGFIPNKNSGVVGQNWNLTAGGAITRVVKGVPDDKKDTSGSSLDDQYTKDHTGYIAGIQSNPVSSYPSQSNVESLSFLSSSHTNTPGYPQVTGPNVLYEYNPDIFSFNFLGHSGTFVMGNDGQVKVNSDRRYKVDMSGFQPQNNLGTRISTLAFKQTISDTPNLNTGIISLIKMTSDDGYEFHFGGKLSALEISFNYPQSISRSVEGTSGVINAWYLIKIITPDGDECNFDYGFYTYSDAFVLNRLTSELAGSWDNEQLYPISFFDIRLYFKNHHQIYSLYNANNTALPELELKKSLIKLAYLKKIETKLHTISFTYSRRNEYNSNYFYSNQPGGTDFETMVKKNRNYFISKLEQISIRDKLSISRPMDDGDFLGGPILNFDFVYQFYGDNSKGNRLFLKEVINRSNNTKHQFEYKRTNELAHPLVAAVDKWGFYNAEPGNVRLVNLNTPVYGDPGEFETNFTSSGQIRTANPSVADVGLIQNITYPTGGKTEFEFEGHTFKKYLKRKVNATGGNSMIPEWITSSQDEYAGGCRLKRISSTSPGVATQTVRYKYIRDYHLSTTNPSSGLLTDYGVFRIRYEKGNGDYHDQVFDQNIAAASGFSESHICYSEVQEILGAENEGFSRYIYTNPDDQSDPNAARDNYFNGANTVRLYATDNNIPSLINQMKRLARYSSRHTERGKLRKREIYAAGTSTPERTEEYVYNIDPGRFSEKTVGYEKIYNMKYNDQTAFFGHSYFFQSFHLYHYHNNPSQIITKTFANGQILTETTQLTYKSNSNPLLSERISTRSDGTVYKTQFFYPEDRVGNPDFPFSAGMVAGHMVSAVLEEKNFMNAVPLTTNKYIYADVTGNGSYKPVQTFSLDHTVAGAVQEEGLNISYYTDGTVKESLKKHDFKSAYLWDYVRMFPIAEVKNVQDASDVAFTSFETAETWATGGYNQWQLSNLNAALPSFGCPTGSKAFNLNYNGTSQQITRSISPAMDYVVSLWVKGGTVDVSGLSAVSGLTYGPWTYKEYTASGLSTLIVSGTGWIDELRLYPKGSQMTTYTYQPLHGITTICDANNKVNYYIYDLSGRLTLIRDKDFNIIKKICYNYSGQAVNCSNVYLRNVETSEMFYKSDCPTGYEGGRVTYTVPANTYASSVDQADANSQAQRDIALNGQSYANNYGTCFCTVISCAGEGKKCVNGVCETGQKKYIASTFMKGTGLWACVYVYEWSDCTLSQQFSETSTSACTLTPTCLDY